LCVCIQCRPEVGYCILPVSHDLGLVFREFVIGVEVSKMVLRMMVLVFSGATDLGTLGVRGPVLANCLSFDSVVLVCPEERARSRRRCGLPSSDSCFLALL